MEMSVVQFYWIQPTFMKLLTGSCSKCRTKTKTENKNIFIDLFQDTQVGASKSSRHCLKVSAVP